MELNGASDVPVADLKHTGKIIVIFHVWWWVFLSGGNPYKALQFL